MIIKDHSLLLLILTIIYTSVPQVFCAVVPQEDIRAVVAVLDLKPENVSKGEAAVVTELLRDELLKSGLFKMVEKQRIEDVVAEQAFQQKGLTQDERIVQLGQLLNVRKVFLGTLGKIQDVRFLTVRMVDVETGRVEVSAKEQDFSAREADQAVIRIVRTLRGLPPIEYPLDISSPGISKMVRYSMVYTGWNVGSMVNFHAESVLENGPEGSGIPIWRGNSPEVNSVASFPNLGLRLGAWKKWFGGDLEISALSHNTPAQSVHYDMQNPSYVWLPVERIFYPVELDTLNLPEKFLRMFSLGFGGNFYIHIPSKRVQSYVGIGASLLMNKVVSNHPGPGNYALNIQGEKLNSTSLGWAIHFPLGIKVPVSNTVFIYLEFRVAQHYFSYVSGDIFQEERDKFTLQTFQLLLGTGRIFR